MIQTLHKKVTVFKNKICSIPFKCFFFLQIYTVPISAITYNLSFQ